MFLNNKPLRYYNLVIVLVVGVIIGATIIISTLTVVKHYNTEQIEESLKSNANMLKIQYNNFFDAKKEELKAVANSTNRENIEDESRNIMESFSHYEEIYLLGDSGEPFYRDQRYELPSSVHQNLALDHFDVSNKFDTDSDKKLLALSYPLENGSVIGLLSLDYINQHLKVDSIQLGETGHPYLLDDQGNILVHKDEDLLGRNVLDLIVDDQGERLELEELTENQENFLSYSLFGKERLAGLSQLANPAFIAGLSMNTSEAYQGYNSLKYTLVSVLLMLLVVSIFICKLVSDKFLNNISSISNNLGEMVETNNLKELEVGQGPQEIITLKESINSLFNRLNEINLGGIKSLVLTIEAKDHYTRGHSQRVTLIADAIARRQNLSLEERKILRNASILHDIGKLAIPDDILKKPESLSDSEFAKIKSHPARGKKILKPLKISERELNLVHQHHERPDGKGYPQGLTKEDIDPLSFIISVADAFEAMTSDRSYRRALDIRVALEELQKGKDTQFDSSTVDTLLELIEEGEIKGISKVNHLYDDNILDPVK